jgi:hypothetical protein
MSRTRLVFDCPRHLAAGLELIAIADGTDRAAVLQRAVLNEIERSGLRPSLDRLVQRHKR